MHLVITKLTLKPDRDTHPQFQALFDDRVPPLLGQYPSWQGADVSIERETNTVVVGYWDDEQEMRNCLASPDHGALMQQLAENFAGAPEVTITETTSRVGALAA